MWSYARWNQVGEAIWSSLGVGSHDHLIFLAAMILLAVMCGLLLTAFMAWHLPARRVLKIEPARLLRQE